MSALFIIAHAPLASALKQAASHCFPEAAQSMAVLDVSADWTPEFIQAQARELLAKVQATDVRSEVLVLTDVFGATPCNAVHGLADGVHVKVIAGVNVPMLWRALNYASEPLVQLVTRALDGATAGVMQIAPHWPTPGACSAAHDQDQRHHLQ